MGRNTFSSAFFESIVVSSLTASAIAEIAASESSRPGEMSSSWAKVKRDSHKLFTTAN